MDSGWQVVRLCKTLGEQAGPWDALNARLFSSHPMLQSHFVDCLLSRFGTGAEHLAIFRSDGTVHAMCLLEPHSLGIWRSFLPSQAQVAPTLASAPGVFQGLFGRLPGLTTRIDLLCNDPAFGDLSKGYYATTSCQNHALTMRISLQGDFASYWASRSKNLVKNLSRYARRAATDQLTPRFMCITAIDHIGAAVARYGALESSGWKARHGTAIHADNAQGTFYTDLLSRFAASGHALVFELWLGEQLAATRLAIASSDMVIILKTTYDENLIHYAPGRQLLKAVIQHLYASYPGKIIEFYTDASPDNLVWATDQRWIKNISIYRNAFTENSFALLRAGQQLVAARPKAQLQTQEKTLIQSTQPTPCFSVSTYHHPDDLPPDTQPLFDHYKQRNPQFSTEWYRNLVQAVYPQHPGVRIYVLRQDNHPVAALPLLINKTLGGHRVESLGNYYTSCYSPLLSPHLRATTLVHLINFIKNDSRPLVSLRLAPMDPDSADFSTLMEALHLSGLVSFRFFCFGNWHLPISTNWHSYLNQRTGQLRNTIKRTAKKFAVQGGTLELITDTAQLDRGAAAYASVYAMSWKKPEPYPHFITGLMRTCATHRWLRLGIAWLHGQPIAAQLWMVSNGKASIYKLAYHQHYKAHSAGTLLTAMLLAHAIDQDKVTEVDYLSGDDPYKKTWMTHRRERWGLMAYNPTTLGGLWGTGKEVLGRSLAPLVK